MSNFGPWSPTDTQTQRSLWTYKPGLINNYPRPQGKLPASEWLYKKEESPKSMYDFLKSDIFGSLSGSLSGQFINTKIGN